MTTQQIIVTAQTIYGAMHGFESLIQLAELQAGGRRVIRGVPWNIVGKGFLRLPPTSCRGLRPGPNDVCHQPHAAVCALARTKSSLLPLPYHGLDAPRFSHRAILIDSSRHFLPLPVIQTMIDAMAMAKLNVLHWSVEASQL